MTRVHLCAFALLALGGCGGIDIDIPEWETGDVDGGLDIGGDLAGDLDDGWTSNPDDGGDDDGDDDDGDDGEVDDGDDGDDGDDDDGGDVETSVADDGTDDGPIFGECCDPHDEPGCDDPEITACVCAVDPFCCSNFWDPICVDEVSELGCGLCEGHDDGDDDVGDDEIGDDDVGEVGSSDGDDGNDDGGHTGPCCEAHDGGGCEYPDVAACVCEADPFCCDQMWDELCVAEVDMLDCGVCGSVDDGGTEDGGTDEGGTDDGSNDDGTDDGGSTGACCEAHDSAGCEYPEVEDCVCLFDAFCCDVTWDEICVDEVEGFACGICS